LRRNLDAVEKIIGFSDDEVNQLLNSALANEIEQLKTLMQD